LMRRFHAVEGFTMNEVMLCFAAVLMAFSIAECFARGFDHFAPMLGNGEFDRIMVRPRNVILQVLGSKIEFTRLGRFLQAVVMFCVLLPTCGVEWTGDKILTLALMIAGGTVVFTGLFIIYASICFFTTEGLEFMNIFTDGGRQFGAYPLAIYGDGILKFYTFVIPLALCQYYPMLYLTGRTSEMFYCFLPMVSVVFLAPCLLLWRLGIRHYKSTGS
ncbi:MAG: ABC transporter permease, partial [Eubacteriales bacterium]